MLEFIDNIKPTNHQVFFMEDYLTITPQVVANFLGLNPVQLGDEKLAREWIKDYSQEQTLGL